MFGYNARNLRTLHSYDDARRLWSNAKRFRGRDREYDERKLDGDKKHITIRKGNNNQIICRYHATDVVVFYADGNLEVDGSYASRSTDMFSHALTCGTGCTMDSMKGVAWANGLGYFVDGDTAVFDLNESKLLNPRPIFTYALKLDKARELRKHYDFDGFKAWRAMTIALKGEPYHGYRNRKNPKYRPNRGTLARAYNLYQDRENWLNLAMDYSEDYVLRALYYAHPECVATRERGPFTSWSDYASWRSLDSKYGWALKG